MNNQEAVETLTAKAECIRREASGTDIDCKLRNCDECDLCYKQGTMGDQMEALGVAISALQAQDLQPICNELAKDTNVPCKDTISRQAAIDALKGHRALFCDNTPDTFSKLSYGEKCRVDELDTAISTLVNLPSAQSTQTDTSNTLKSLDCVERQAAIDAVAEGLKNTFIEYRDVAEKMIGKLPSAQSESCMDLIVSEIEETIRETKESGKHHDINVRANDDLICYGLQLALEIIEEKRNERFDIQAIGD